MTMDVTKAIEPKSDQKNYDDFLNGPQTFKIKNVEVKNTAEQPVWIHLDGHEGKPWKPSKTSLRCLSAIWGPDASKWSGLSLTLYGDPEVTWGGMKVGGIRVSHMEGLTAPRTLMLTKTRGKKGATVIKPLEVTQAPKPPAINRDQLRAQMEAVASDAQAKGKWWRGLTEEEQAVVREMAAEKEGGE